jgi:hypothetical protein
MLYPYGYIKGTLGTDGDAVDVFVGIDENSDKVFVITTNKAPDFKEIDEQKIMLGFSSEAQAKLAFLKHYSDKRFFRGITTLSMDSFKGKLKTLRGKLIKSSLIGCDNSDKISVISDVCTVRSEHMKTAQEQLEDVAKALSSLAVNGFAKQARQAQARDNYTAAMEWKAGIAQEQPGVGSTRVAEPTEPTAVPVRSLHNAPSHTTPGDAEIYKSCTGCGRMVKSLASCLTRSCQEGRKGEAGPHWKRG